jgi:hypothetical protein
MVESTMKFAKTPASAKPTTNAQTAMEARRRAWQEAATISSQAAREDLLARGIGYVYERDGIIYRRMADGSEQIVSNSKLS